MSYATVANLREYLDQVRAGAAVDAALQSVLDRAQAIINDALGFSFGAYVEAAEKDVRARGGEWLWLPAYEAGSVATVAQVSGRGTAYESITVVDDYVADEESRPYRLWREAGWERGDWYRVTAAWGYGPAPANIVEVELEVAINIWRSRDAATFSDAMGPEGQGGFTVNRAMTWAQRSIIEGVRTAYLGVVHA